MKDEIKEILEYVLSLTYGNENAIKGINKIKDYITNLQEDLDYQRQAEIEYNEKHTKLMNKYKNLQEENDILKRDIEAMKHNYNLLVRCIENGESMTQKFENGLTYQDYKSRNEKAIEYIENDMPYLQEVDEEFENVDGEVYFTYKEWNGNELLNILQGDDKDE